MKLRRTWAACAAAVVFLVFAAIPTRAVDGPTLAALVAQATGVQRTYDPRLEAVARVRAVEIQSTFDHRPLPELNDWWWGEVIAWNRFASNPAQVAVDAWMKSPSHEHILVDPFYRGIGCAETVASDNKHYFVCLVGQSSVGQESIPDTAMEQVGQDSAP